MNFGSCGLWQCTHKRYCFLPFHSPVRLPWMPAFQSLNIVPWHWPQRRYDSSKETRSPLANRSASRSFALWQSRHQRCSLAWLNDSEISTCSSASILLLRFTSISSWQSEQGKMPSENGGGGTKYFGVS